jgi:hypothetical protein
MNVWGTPGLAMEMLLVIIILGVLPVHVKMDS